MSSYEQIIEVDWKKLGLLDQSTKWLVKVWSTVGKVVDISQGLQELSITKSIGEISVFTLTYRPVIYRVDNEDLSLGELLRPNDLVAILYENKARRKAYAVFLGLVDSISVDLVRGVTKEWTYRVSGRGWEKVFLYPYFLSQSLVGLVAEPKYLPVGQIFTEIAPLKGTPTEALEQLVDAFYGKVLCSLAKDRTDEGELKRKYNLLTETLPIREEIVTGTPLDDKAVIPFSRPSPGGGWTPVIPKPIVVEDLNLPTIGQVFLGMQLNASLNDNVSLLQVMVQIIGGDLWNDIIFDVAGGIEETGAEIIPVIYTRRRPIGEELAEAEGFSVREEVLLNQSISISDSAIFNVFDLQFTALYSAPQTDFMTARLVAEDLSNLIEPWSIRKHGLRVYSASTYLFPNDIPLSEDVSEFDKSVAKAVESPTSGMYDMFIRLKKMYSRMWLSGTVVLPYIPGIRAGTSFLISKPKRTSVRWNKDYLDELYNVEQVEISWRFGSLPKMTLQLTRGFTPTGG